MNKEDLNHLLDNIYELEGLVHLALNRDDNPEALPQLITRKGKELAAAAALIGGDDCTDTDVADNIGIPEADQPAVHGTPETDTEIYRTTVETFQEPEIQDADEVQEVPEEIVETPEEPVRIAQESKEPEAEEIPAPVRSGKTAEPVEPKGRLVFSINDRYRFKRELFDGSDADFNNTLALVASMESYDEAEDYFLGELQWDQKSREVTDFLEILKKYFKE